LALAEKTYHTEGIVTKATNVFPTAASHARAVIMAVVVVSLALGPASWAVTSRQAHAGTAWPLGTLTILPDNPTCLARFTCSKFVVSGCTGVSSDAQGVLAEADPSDPETVRGSVVFFSGSEGLEWWSAPSLTAEKFLSKLRSRDHFVVVQVKWLDSWLKSPSGVDEGPAHLACRSATTIDWIYQNVYLPLGITPGEGECGFCITGNSGGASQVAYAMSHYGLDGVVNAAFPTSGPPHAAQEKGCLPGFPHYRYEVGPLALVDLSYGFDDGQGDLGPCLTKDSSFAGRWEEESVDTGANDTSYPATRIHFLIGANDTSSAVPHAADYRDLLQQDPSNDVTWTLVPNMAHAIQTSLDGLAALEATLTA